MYKSGVAICDGVLQLGIDAVYARSRLGDQGTIAALLNQNIGQIQVDTAGHSSTCVQQVFRALCYYYLTPCGDSSHPSPPSSLCPEECEMVQEKCQPTWDAVLLSLGNIDPPIDCNDTSRLLFPVPHCCTGAELGIELSLFSVFVSLPHHHAPRNIFNVSSLGNLAADVTSQLKDDKTLPLIMGGVSLFLIIVVAAVTAIVVVIILRWVLPERQRKRRIEEVQLDILARWVTH